MKLLFTTKSHPCTHGRYWERERKNQNYTSQVIRKSHCMESALCIAGPKVVEKASIISIMEVLYERGGTFCH